MFVGTLRAWCRFSLTVLVVGLTVLTACGDDDSAAETPTLTVEQLVARSADTPVTVQGFLIDQEGATRLCAAILESYPPQCGEPAVHLVGLDLDQLDGTQTDQGLTWKESVTVTVQRRQDAQFDVLSVESGSPE